MRNQKFIQRGKKIERIEYTGRVYGDRPRFCGVDIVTVNLNIINFSKRARAAKSGEENGNGVSITYPACKQRVSKCDIVIGNWERIVD